jgi:hypothetical protein
MPLPLIGELGRIVFTSALGLFASEALRNSFRDKQEQQAKIGAIMSYDLIGNDFDFIGADFISGDDDDMLDSLVSGSGNSDIIGAVKAAARSGNLQAQATLRKLAMRNGGAVINRPLDRKRRYPLGFVPTDIIASNSQSIPAAPQNLFRPERLVIPSDISFDVGVKDIKVGNQSQLAQSVEVPGALFSEVAIDTQVTFDTAEVGNQISVDIRNKTAASLPFTAGLLGTVAKS